MSKAPEICLYCDGEGNSSAGGRCGFCENGKPLDTQEDWDNGWGKVFKLLEEVKKSQKVLDEAMERLREVENRYKEKRKKGDTE